MTNTPSFEGQETVSMLAIVLDAALPALFWLATESGVDLDEVIQNRYGGDEAEKNLVVGLATGFQTILDAVYAYEDQGGQ